MADVPQLNERTGVSFDYFNAVAYLPLVFYNFGIDGVNEKIRTNPLRTYQQYFAGMEDLVDDKNRTRVARINRIIGALNEKARDEMDERTYKKAINALHHLIYGWGLHKVYPNF